MSRDEPRGQAPGVLDPEAEQEVDFGRYARLLAARWWLVAAGIVAGALVGYAVALGGSQVYKASATVYLGQPYSASGNISLQTLQTNPSAVGAIVHSESVLRKVASSCTARPGDFRGGVSTSSVPGNLVRNGQNPVVRITVQAKRAKKAACAANGLARAVVDKISPFANQKIANFQKQISADEQAVATIKQGIASANVSTTDKLLFQLQLRTLQQDQIAASQLLLQATQVEKPQILTGAAAQKVTARSRRNTVVVAALIGLVLGALLALAWDRLAPRLARRNGA